MAHLSVFSVCGVLTLTLAVDLTWQSVPQVIAGQKKVTGIERTWLYTVSHCGDWQKNLFEITKMPSASNMVNIYQKSLSGVSVCI